MKKITGVISPEGVAAEVLLPKETDFHKASHLLVLDGVNDPGNMGTLIRTALALGWNGVFLLPNCCDPFNEKAIRASKGAIFRLPYKRGDWHELLNIVKKNQMDLLVADMGGKAVDHLSEKTNAIALVLGNEAQGVSERAKKECVPIAIPMRGKMESLNVAIAGGIFLYLLKEGKNA